MSMKKLRRNLIVFAVVKKRSAREQILNFGGNKDYTLPKWTSTVEVKVANEVKFKLNNLIRKIKNLKSDLENIQAQSKGADSSPQTDNKSSHG